jgi:chromosome segregation ATPase
LSRFLGFEISETTANAPEAVFEQCKKLFQKKVATYDRALASRAAFCVVLRQQIAQLESERTRLNTALEAQAKALKPDPSAGELALRWDAHGKELDDLRNELAVAERNCSDLAAARDQAIQEARAKLAELKGALGHNRISQALAEIAEQKKDGPGEGKNA